ncbi:HVO_2922 family protein [Halostella salina]|uniref:HVO_2922 family protein n=1 Tax=Halostella salina TaxID=1547897 RepID=UPI000EF766FA|nr:HVO_2922 family protein [Halostella salina]
MSNSTDNALVDWYSDNVATPTTSDEAYGYWAFVVGAALGLVGFALFLLSTTATRGTDSFWLYRTFAFSIGALALPVLMYGFIVVLPLQQRATQVAYLGLAVSLVSVVAFVFAYPSNWNVASGDYSTLILTAYAVGIGIEVVAAFLFPAVSAETAAAPATGGAAGTGDDDASPATDEPESKATFELYPDRKEEWRWRLRHDNGNIVADGGEGYTDVRNAKKGIESVRRNAPGAALDKQETPPKGVDHTEEPAATEDDAASGDEVAAALPEPDADPDDGATVEVYEDRGGSWRWRLRHDNGNIVADGGEGYASRSALADAVERLTERVADADTLEHDPTAFEIYRDNADEWRWRLRHRNGRILADGGEGYASRSNAVDAVDRVRERVDADPEVYEDAAGKYRWRLKAGNGEIIADSSQGYASKSGAEAGFERVRSYAPDADTLEFDPLGFEVFVDRAGEYRWRLRHRNGNIVADGGEGYSSKQNAKKGIAAVQRTAPHADVVEE